MSTITVQLTQEEIDMIVACLVDRQEKALTARERTCDVATIRVLDRQIKLNAGIQTRLRESQYSTGGQL